MEAESPFSQYLNSNYVPTSAEADQVKALVADQQRIVDDIDAELRALDEQRKALSDRRQRHATYMDQHSALISPARRLPSDILASIFLLAVADDYYLLARELAPKTMEGYPPNLPPCVILTHVCRHWRELALNLPLLWSDHIEAQLPRYPKLTGVHSARTRAYFDQPLQPPPPPVDLPIEVQQQNGKLVATWKRECEKRLDLIRTYLSRSQECPLEIAFEVFRDSRDIKDINAQLEVYVQLLVSVSSRWKKARLYLELDSPDSPLIPLLELPISSFPILQQLDINVDLRGERSDVFHDQQIGPTPRPWRHRVGAFSIAHAPSLTALTFRIDVGGIHSLAVPWEGLTYLSLNRPGAHVPRGYGSRTFTYVDALKVLENCPNLVRCVLRLDAYRSEHPIPSEIAHFMMAAGLGQGGNTQLPPGMAPSPSSSAQSKTQEPITLPYLRQLTLLGGSQPPEFPTLLDLPSLRSLCVVHPMSRTRDEKNSDLVKWIDLYGPQLTDVAFEYVCLSQSALHRCLSQLPAVKSLRLAGLGASLTAHPLHDFGSDDSDDEVAFGHLIAGNPPSRPRRPPLKPATINKEILAALTPTIGRECFCPNAQSFEFWTGSMEYGEMEYVELIAARRDAELCEKVGGRRVQDILLSSRRAEAVVGIKEELGKRGVDLEEFECHVAYGRKADERVFRRLTSHPLVDREDDDQSFLYSMYTYRDMYHDH